ncbi:MAG: 5'-3'-deoxyribonucleotidase [Cytophagales bacterium]|nr:5'-3'-deoxyribonucleotidase [Bernardetiaceae bacterium]MDW8205203.1 5'-3'-deoxyribonucleotidase [Cytophagales bacterium]
MHNYQQRIAIDMDDVMADATGRFVEWIAERHGVVIERHQLRDEVLQTLGVPYAQLRKWLWEDGFFRYMQPMPDSQKVMQELVKKYEVFVVSAAVEFPQSLREKVDWLAEHFPFIDWRYIVLCGHKYMIQADYLIDDHEKNLIHFTGTPIIFTAPHNLHLQGYERVNNWAEIGERFL